MNKTDMLKLSYATLVKMRTDLEEAIAEKEVLERESAREELEKRAKELGFTASDLFSGPKAKAKPKAKYAHPENPAKTWAGRGRQPHWVKDHLEKGGQLSDLEI